jgi:hypothetical protein
MDYEPSGPFITSVLELKLDVNTMFEWQRHSQDDPDVPHYRKLLEFINLSAQESETPLPNRKWNESHTMRNNAQTTNLVTSFATNASDSTADCVLCKGEKHPLYACVRFKALAHDKMVSTLKSKQPQYELPEAWTFRQAVQVRPSLQTVSEATSHTFAL